MTKFTCKIRVLLIAAFIVAVLPLKLMAQANTVAGKVVSAEDNTPLPGANVLVKGTSIGTVTDVDGNYSIKVPDENETLVFSFIGYTSQEVSVSQRSEINISMARDLQSLEEVVVIGYGTQKKVNLIGSVEAVSNKEIVSAPVSNISNALAGRLPGAIIQQRSGEPGGDMAEILIRGKATLGDNSPLVVVDGIPGRDLNSLNPNDIESISILKDASAAIYGARAANGVILVTTKEGKKGTPAKFTYEFFEGFLSPTKLPEMADAATFAQMSREYEEYNGTNESNMTFSEEDIEKYRSGQYPWTHPNTNWYDATLKDYSRTSDHNFSVRGGSENVTYYGAFGMHNANGLYKNEESKEYNRYNLTANIKFKVNDYLNLGLNIRGTMQDRFGSTVGQTTIFNVVNQAMPVDRAYYPNGLVAEGTWGPSLQPIVISSLAPGFEEQKNYRSNNLLSADFKVPGVEGLSLSSWYAFDLDIMQKKNFANNPVYTYSLDEAAYFGAGNDGSQDGSEFLEEISGGGIKRLRDDYSDSRLSSFNFKVNYDKTFNDIHNLSAFVAYEQSEFLAQNIYASRQDFVSAELPFLFAGPDELKNNGGSASLDARVNYFGRVSYNYKEKYHLQFSLRRDGSLRFSKESGRWGTFPAVLAGWTVSNEDFWKNNVNSIDFLKIRASYAQMGNDLVPPFQYLGSYSFPSPNAGIYGNINQQYGMAIGSSRSYLAGLRQAVAPNPFITWEVANVYNIGFESSLFDSKINLDADFFYEKRTDILVKRNASVPDFTGLSLPDENFGEVENKGVEVKLGYNDHKGSFRYGINGNFTFARNKIIFIDEAEQNVPWQARTGHPQGAQLLYKSAGIFKNEEHVNSLPSVPGAGPGDIIIEDIDGNGEITFEDKILFDKTADPEITFGMSFNFGYKNWELSGLVYGTGSAMFRMAGTQMGPGVGNYFQYMADGRWTPENTDADKPRAFMQQNEYWKSTHVTDMEYQDKMYIRMKNLQLSYKLPERLFDAIDLQNAQIFVSGQNLFLIYAKQGIWDPEFGDSRSESRDFYPLMKVIALGARITL